MHEQHVKSEGLEPSESQARLAASATLHCLLGCGVGEVVGVVIGVALALSNVATLSLAVTLGFVLGFALGLIPLMRAGLGWSHALHASLLAAQLFLCCIPRLGVQHKNS